MRHAELVEQREDRVIDSLHRSLAREKRSSLTRGMYFPVGWDPYFVEFITWRTLSTTRPSTTTTTGDSSPSGGAHAAENSGVVGQVGLEPTTDGL